MPEVNFIIFDLPDLLMSEIKYEKYENNYFT